MKTITKTTIDGEIISVKTLTDEEYAAYINRVMASYRKADQDLEEGRGFNFSALYKSENK